MNPKSAIDEFYAEERIERIVARRHTYKSKQDYLRDLKNARATLRRIRQRRGMQ